MSTLERHEARSVAAAGPEDLVAKLRGTDRRSIGRSRPSPQQEVRWHVAQMLPRLDLTRRERTVATNLLLDYLRDDSRIVQTLALQALVDLARTDVTVQTMVRPIVDRLAATDSPAVRNRARKLIHEFVHDCERQSPTR